MYLRDWMRFLRSPDGGGAGGGGEGGGQQDNSGGQPQGGPQTTPANQGGQQQQQQQNQNNGQQQQQSNNQQQQQQQNNQGPYRPEGLPDDLAGKSDRETIDKLFGVNKGFREAQSQRGAVPKEAAGYQLGTLPEPIAKKLGDLSKDPAVGAVREAALKSGMTDKQFSAFMPAVLELFDKAGFIPDAAQFDPKVVLSALEADHATIADPRERSLAAAKRVTDYTAILNNLKAGKHIGDGAALALQALTLDAAEFRDGEKIVKALTQMPGVSIGEGGGGQGQGASDADILARRMDPRYDTRSPKYDKAFREQTDTMWQQADARKRTRSAA